MDGIGAHALSVLAFALLVSAPLPLASAALVLRPREGRRLWSGESALIVLTVWILAQAVVAHLLGLLHRLGLAGVLVAELVLLAAGTMALRRVGAGTALAAFALPLPSERSGVAQRGVLLSATLMALVLVWWCAAMPVVDWDSWAFHMPHMAQWLQTGSFTRMVQEAHRPRNSYPYGWEALCTPFLLPFGEDVLVTFPNLVAWALLGAALYVLARFWGAARLHASACAALLLAVPIIAWTVNTMHVDVPFAALVLAAATLGAIGVTQGAPLPLGLAVATIGLACATRVTGPAYALLLLLWLAYLRRRRPRRRADAARWPLVAGALVGIGLAAFWYVRNLLELDHPLGAGAPFAGAPGAEGSWAYFRSHTLLFTVSPFSPSTWKVVGARAADDLGLPFLALAALAAAWPLSRAPVGAVRGGELWSLLLALAALFWVTPLSATSGLQIRLGLPFVGMVAVAAAVAASRVRLPHLIALALTALAAWSSFSGSRVFYALAPLVVLAGLPHWARLRTRRRALALAGAAALAFAVFLWFARERRERERHYVYGPFYAYLETRAAPDEPLAYLFSLRSYLFYGRRLARTLTYAPFAAGDDPEAWAEPLRRRGIRLVVSGPWTSGDAFDQLTATGGPLVRVAGGGGAGDINVFELRPQQP